MISRAALHFLAPLPSLLCVGSGQTTGLFHFRAIRKNLLREVAAP